MEYLETLSLEVEFPHMVDRSGRAHLMDKLDRARLMDMLDRVLVK